MHSPISNRQYSYKTGSCRSNAARPSLRHPDQNVCFEKQRKQKRRSEKKILCSMNRFFILRMHCCCRRRLSLTYAFFVLLFFTTFTFSVTFLCYCLRLCLRPPGTQKKKVSRDSSSRLAFLIFLHFSHHRLY